MASKAKPNVSELAQRAREQLSEMTGRRAESVLGVERNDDDDGWQVTLEVLELERVPNSTDLLGCYVVGVDSGGEITDYRRVRRYSRGQADEG
jgi:Gas vesicle synthesis protein GvpO